MQQSWAMKERRAALWAGLTLAKSWELFQLWKLQKKINTARILGGDGKIMPFFREGRDGGEQVAPLCPAHVSWAGSEAALPVPSSNEALVLRQCGTPLYREMQSQGMKRLSGVVHLTVPSCFRLLMTMCKLRRCQKSLCLRKFTYEKSSVLFRAVET